MRNHGKLTTMALVTALLGAQGCRHEEDEEHERKAIAELHDAQGNSVGEAKFEEVENGVEIHFEGKHLPPGTHGFHIHDTGECNGPNFESAGEHFNPTHAEHGDKNPKGHHLGDLPNLHVGNNGEVDVTDVVEGANLADSGERSLLGGDGTALIIHTSADDGMSNPSGNAGGRIACGVIRRP